MKLRVILFSFFLVSVSISFSQKPALDHSLYDSWESVGTQMISNDGKWIGFSINPQEGDRELFLYATDDDTRLNFQRGEKLTFTDDSRFAVFTIRPFYRDIKAVRDKKMKKEELPKDTLVIVDLHTREVTRIADIQSHQISEKESAILVYHVTPPEDEDKNRRKSKDHEPAPLYMTDLTTGNQFTYENVIKYTLSKRGNSLAIVTQDPQPEEQKDQKDDNQDNDQNEKQSKNHPLNTIQWIETSTGTDRTLISEEGDFTRFHFDDSGEKLIFVGTTSPKDDLSPAYQLYYFDTDREVVINNENNHLPEDWIISPHRTPRFSKDGNQLYFGIAPAPIPKDTSLNINDHAIVDIWSYKDDYLQSIQLNRLKRDLEKSYLAVSSVQTPDQFQPLGDEELENITLIDEGNADFVMTYSNTDSRLATQWLGSDRRDYYLIDNKTGQKTQFTDDLFGYASASPSGKYILYFDREKGNWYSFDTRTQSTKRLDDDIPVSLTDELWDLPDAPRAYGIAAWTDDDRSVLIKDRYDLWEIFPDGSQSPRNITRGMGRKNKITFETFHLDRDQKTLDRNTPILLSAFDHTSKQQGLFRMTIADDAEPEKIFMEDIWGIRSLQKAKNAEKYIYTKESYVKSPDLYVSEDFTEEKQLTKTNLQQENYNWGTAELVRWSSSTNQEAAGILYKPEDFDPNKKYPMIVYFYERLSDGLNRYIPPTPTPSRLNISFFVSNGYLVFAPDIAYTIGYPGRSAEEYVNSGVEYLKKNQWVDGEKIGIQGQSWGGYQVAHLITRTDMYAAAWSGAPVVNMTSAYGGIRWATGMNRQFQYEKTQSRIGKTLWEDLDLYIENSPLFHLDKVNTPVVIMANDDDGAVPWWQGIEMFTALRRLGKPSWMLNYNNDAHNLVKRQNRKDIQIRQQQFFDHYLKGAKAPAWMTQGIPATMKGKTWGFELTDEEP